MSYFTEVMSDSPRAYYRMDEASGQPQDSSGNGNHTTVTGGSPTYQQSGPILTDTTSYSILFNDTFADYFSAPHNSTLNCVDTVTLEFWYKPVYILGGETIILAKGLGAYGADVVTRRNGMTNDGNSVLMRSNFDMNNVNKWYHWVSVKSGSTRKVYVDGADVTELGSFSTLVDTTNVLFIGSDTLPPNCYLAHIAIYGTAFTQERARAHYNAARPMDPLTAVKSSQQNRIGPF